jgi:hypothetical protein
MVSLRSGHRYRDTETGQSGTLGYRIDKRPSGWWMAYDGVADPTFGGREEWEAVLECEHQWGTDGMHSNVFCKQCFNSQPEDSSVAPAEVSR